MFSNLVKDSLLYGIANAIQKMVPFFIIPIVTGYLGQEALKIYDVSFVYAYLFSWLIVAGQDAAAAILYFDKRKTQFDKKQVTSYALFIQLVLLVLLLCIFLFFSDRWSVVLFSKDDSLTGWWFKALFILPGFILMNYALNILLWEKKQGSYVALCSLLTGISILSVAAAVIIFEGGLTVLFYCLIGSMSVSGLVGVVMIRHYVFISLFPVNWVLVKKLLWLGIPFALTAFFHQLLPSIDRYFLIHYNYSHSLAIYVLAAKLGSFMSFGVSAFVLAFTPYSMAKLNENDAEKEISKVFRFVSMGAFLLVPFLLLFKDLLISLFADSSYQYAAKLLPFFFFGWVFDLFCYFSLLGIYRSQKTVLQLVLFFTATAIISLSNMWLIPAYGLHGAAFSFCGTKAMLFFISLIWFRRYFHLRINAFSFLSALIVAITCSYLIYALPLAANITVLAVVLAAAIFYFFKRIPIDT